MPMYSSMSSCFRERRIARVQSHILEKLQWMVSYILCSRFVNWIDLGCVMAVNAPLLMGSTGIELQWKIYTSLHTAISKYYLCSLFVFCLVGFFFCLSAVKGNFCTGMETLLFILSYSPDSIKCDCCLELIC